MRQRGTILVAVLAVTALAAMVAVSLLFVMRAEVAASAAAVQGEQARAAAMSGIRLAAGLALTAGAEIDAWTDNPSLLRNRLVFDDGRDRWYFVVWADNPADPGAVRYGLTDEAGKVNLNVADAETLAALPGMTDALVDALIDWRDSDDEARPQGAEREYYETRPMAYAIRNGSLPTLEELLLVRGFDARVVYGEDANLSGLLDPNEDDFLERFPPDDADGLLATGLRRLTTVWSRDPNVDALGRPRLDINGDTEALDDADLPEATPRYIRLLRAEGHTFGHPAELLEARYQLRKTPKGEPGLKAGDWITSGVGLDELPTVLDRLTVGDGGVSGLVNVNTARAVVLAALPGIDENLALRILDTRGRLAAAEKTTPAWLLTQGLVNQEEFIEVARHLTARGYQYHIQSIGFGVPCGRFAVVEAVVDFADGAARVVYLRDVTRLGLPFALDVETLEI